jgi:hypothetical protein
MQFRVDHIALIRFAEISHSRNYSSYRFAISPAQPHCTKNIKTSHSKRRQAAATAMESPAVSSVVIPMESPAVLKRINFHRQGWVDRSFKDAETNVLLSNYLTSGHNIFL